ncbi:MAG: isoprenylcysteine carboxylmethyltransferase family protein [Boseongicola sp.]|nr:isoprenylcysteine carboxylmethyltransferase family protein [Boseongicola sp.]
MKWIDLPPVWTVAALFVTWAIPLTAPWGPMILPGRIALGAAAVLIAASLVEFMRARTTVIPREAPSALITTGIFRLSRNPIYLADLLLLAGFSLIWGKFLGLVLIPVLAWVLIKRFIAGEEARLSEAFGAEYEAYRAATRRWI